ncbi:MAG: carboxypeptidase regulatory-like domain-containing protein [Isosphaeraceae bacterium]|nr:carboxypeptidase regulatory-like domain-containing protein [Isosphaeraceae bacterium]
MTRPIHRQSPTLESLEKREVLSGPSADAQYMLELVNLARTSPSTIAQHINSSIDADDNATLAHYRVNLQRELAEISGSTPRQPVAWSNTLAAAATQQSLDQANTGIQSHIGADGSDLDTRLRRVGLGPTSATAENAFAYSNSVDQAMKAFLIDWGVDSKGHRKTILQPEAAGDTSFNELGVGIVRTGNKGLGPLVVTQNFARRTSVKPYLLGVAYGDADGNRLYGPGEGRGGITVEARNLADGRVTSTQTWDAGGYQMNLDPGDYQVTASQGDRTIRSRRVSIGSENVKVDFNLNDPWEQSTPPAAPAPIAVAAPAPPVEVRIPVQAPRQIVTPVVATQSSNETVSTGVSRTSSKLNSSLFNPLGWITSWSSWKATNKTNA